MDVKKWSWLLALVLCLAMSSPAMAATVMSTWDANTETDLAGYRIYSSSDENGFVRFVDDNTNNSQCGSDILKSAGEVIGQQQCSVSTEGVTLWFAVTAFDTAGNESGLSNKVSLLIPDKTPPAVPQQFQIRLEMAQRTDGSQEMRLVLYPISK